MGLVIYFILIFILLWIILYKGENVMNWLQVFCIILLCLVSFGFGIYAVFDSYEVNTKEEEVKTEQESNIDTICVDSITQTIDTIYVDEKVTIIKNK